MEKKKTSERPQLLIKKDFSSSSASINSVVKIPMHILKNSNQRTAFDRPPSTPVVAVVQNCCYYYSISLEPLPPICIFVEFFRVRTSEAFLPKNFSRNIGVIGNQIDWSVMDWISSTAECRSC